MFSLVSVVNDPAKMQARLRAGLERQTAPHQLILVDNQDRRFAGAAAALNWGARQAEGDWIIFLHQDVELLASDWLNRAEQYLSEVDANGWHGVVGRTHQGRWRGLLRDRAMIFGEPFGRPLEIQTLDEVLLIHRNRGSEHPYFDEHIPGWHAYGVEACCQALRQGARNCILPLPIWHDSNSTNQVGLGEAHSYVWNKHGGAFRRIYTTCGVLPHPYGWSGSYRVSTFFQRLRGWRHAAWFRLTSVDAAFGQTPWEVLEELTREEPEVDCLHAPANFASMEGVAFTDRTTHPRRIRHHFRGTSLDFPPADCVVIAPELAGDFHSLRQLPDEARRLIVCLYLEDRLARPRHWRWLLDRSRACRLAMEADETRWAILDVALRAETPVF